MSKQYLNIAIAGLSIHESDELKHQLSNILPENFSIQWKTAADVNLDCLFIHEHFYETDGIQRILTTKKFPWLKISKNDDLPGKVEDDTLYFPLLDTQDLNRWIKRYILNQQTPTNQSSHLLETAPIPNQRLTEQFFKKMLQVDVPTKLHLYDQHGTLAIIDLTQNLAWPNTERTIFQTDHTFNYELASTTDLLKVSRKERIMLQDWLWNLFWQSPGMYHLAPNDGDYKIYFWPKPEDQINRKYIFRLSAYFIQGASISEIAQHNSVPTLVVRQFIAANMAAGNLERVNKAQKNYTPPEAENKQDDQSFIGSFISKIRLKFGF